MKLQSGYEFIYTFPQATPVILTTSVHYSRASDVESPDYLTTDPPVPITAPIATDSETGASGSWRHLAGFAWQPLVS